MLTGIHPRPTDVFVEVLARPEAESESAVTEKSDSCGLLGYHRWVVAHGRAGHVGHQLDPLGCLCDRSQRRPGVRGVALAVKPRKVVIADDLEVEAGLLGVRGIADELARAGLFTHQGVTKSGRRCGHGCNTTLMQPSVLSRNIS